MRYWITVVLILFAVEAYGQDKTYDLGNAIANNVGCIYMHENDAMRFYLCDEAMTLSLFVNLISKFTKKYESIEMIGDWIDIDDETKSSVVKQISDHDYQLFLIIYGNNPNVFAITRL